MSNQKKCGILGFIIAFFLVYAITSTKMNYWKPDSINIIYGILAGFGGGVIGSFIAKKDN